jgi:hypothetical protein
MCDPAMAGIGVERCGDHQDFDPGVALLEGL